MMHTYGYVKCKLGSAPRLQSSYNKKTGETQYHLHSDLLVPNGGGTDTWDSAINVGTNDSDDLLKYKLIFDYAHPILPKLRNSASGFTDLTGSKALPAFDFLRSDILANTGPWRPSDVMDGSDSQEPVPTLSRLLKNALDSGADVYIFGRTYTKGSSGVHDVHMNQGSTEGFINTGNNNNDHNDIWQDGAVLVDFGKDQWSAYFTVFTQQMVPTDGLGNPSDPNHPMTDADDGSQTGS